MSASLKLFVTCPRGLEALLVTELEAIDATQVVATGGGVHCRGDWRTVYRANLHSRVATRVLLQLACRDYRNEHDVYAIARAVPWATHFDVTQRIRVDVNAIRSPLRSLDFATLRIKDAVCDRFRDDCGSRPDVDTHAPQVRIAAFLDAHQCTLYLDTSGEPLYKRGYRSEGGDAPLRENLAAGIVLLTGWQADTPLYDPMCGSGTLLVEAAQIALDIAPGHRRHFGFEVLRVHDPALWQAERDAALARRRTTCSVPLFGADLYGDALKLAHATLTAAGLEAVVQLKQGNVLELSPPAPGGVLVTNPPYGKRIGDSDALAAFYPQLGDALKARYAGWRCYLFSADMTLPHRIGLKASRRTPLYNGGLECRLFEYKMVAGSMRTRRQKDEGGEPTPASDRPADSPAP